MNMNILRVCIIAVLISASSFTTSAFAQSTQEYAVMINNIKQQIQSQSAKPEELYKLVLQMISTYRANPVAEAANLVGQMVDLLKPYNNVIAPDKLGLYDSARRIWAFTLQNSASNKITEYRNRVGSDPKLIADIEASIALLKPYNDIKVEGALGIYDATRQKFAYTLKNKIDQNIMDYRNRIGSDPNVVAQIEASILLLKPYNDIKFNNSQIGMYDITRQAFAYTLKDKADQNIMDYRNRIGSDANLVAQIEGIILLLKPYNDIKFNNSQVGMYDSTRQKFGYTLKDKADQNIMDYRNRIGSDANLVAQIEGIILLLKPYNDIKFNNSQIGMYDITRQAFAYTLKDKADQNIMDYRNRIGNDPKLVAQIEAIILLLKPYNDIKFNNSQIGMYDITRQKFGYTLKDKADQNIMDYRNRIGSDANLVAQIESIILLLKPYNDIKFNNSQIGMYDITRQAFAYTLKDKADQNIMDYRNRIGSDPNLVAQIEGIILLLKPYNDIKFNNGQLGMYDITRQKLAYTLKDKTDQSIIDYRNRIGSDPNVVVQIEAIIFLLKPYNDIKFNNSQIGMYDITREGFAYTLKDKAYKEIEGYRTNRRPELIPGIKLAVQLVKPYNDIKQPRSPLGLYDELYAFMIQVLGPDANGPEIKIMDCKQLQGMKLNLAGNYALANDIDCTESKTWNSGAGFSPIGTGDRSPAFSGKLDGKGFTIKNLYTNGEKDLYENIMITGNGGMGSLNVLNKVTKISPRGLFGRTNQATIVNLNLENAEIIGGINEQGVLVGSAVQTSIKNVQVRNGAVRISYQAISAATTGDKFLYGGLVGENGEGSEIFQSSANVNILGHKYVGGLVGANKGSIMQSFASGNIQAGINSFGNAGGLVGQNLGSIKDSYAVTAVRLMSSGNNGGLVAENLNGGLISKSFAAGNVSVGTYNTPPASGLVSAGNTNQVFADSYWDIDRSGTTKGGLMVLPANGIPSKIMTVPNTFKGWDFANTWDICPNQSMPTLKWQKEICLGVATTIATGKIVNPFVYKDDIVWSEERNGNQDIYNYSIKTSLTKRLTSSAAKQELPVMNEKYIAWIDHSSGRPKVAWLDRATGKVDGLASISATDQIDVWISDKYLAWIDFNPLTKIYDIYIRNWEDKQITNITKNAVKNPLFYVVVSNDLIAWLDQYDPIGVRQRLQVFDLKNNRFTPAFGPGSYYVGLIRPAIAGRTVFYTEYNTYYDLIAYNIDYNQQSMYVTKDTFAQLLPSANGNDLTWVEGGTTANDTYLVRKMNTLTGRISEIIIPQSKKTMPTVYENTLAWINNTVDGQQQLSYVKAGEAPKVTLTINRTGDKSIRELFEFTTQPSSAIVCGAQCTASFSKGTAVTLMLRRTDGNKGAFGGWGVPGCVGETPCTIKMEKDEVVNLSLGIQK